MNQIPAHQVRAVRECGYLEIDAIAVLVSVGGGAFAAIAPFVLFFVFRIRFSLILCIVLFHWYLVFVFMILSIKRQINNWLLPANIATVHTRRQAGKREGRQHNTRNQLFIRVFEPIVNASSYNSHTLSNSSCANSFTRFCWCADFALFWYFFSLNRILSGCRQRSIRDF